MGKLGTAFGFGSKGNIRLSLSKPTFVAGELITGTVSVEISERIQCDALILKVSGKQKCSWKDYENSDCIAGVQLLKDKVVICTLPGEYLPGEYSYPFEYQLSPTLTPVFHLDSFRSANESDLRIDVWYKIKATVEVKGVFAADLRAEEPLIVLSPHSSTVEYGEPQSESTTKSVRFLCCINKGECELTVRLDKRIFLLDETIAVACDVDNRSLVGVSAMRCTLHQDVSFTSANHSGRHAFSRKLAALLLPGVAFGSKSSQPFSLRLAPTKEMRPSMIGQFLYCGYRIQIDCAISWSPSVSVVLPVTILAAKDAGNTSNQPAVADQ